MTEAGIVFIGFLAAGGTSTGLLFAFAFHKKKVKLTETQKRIAIERADEERAKEINMALSQEDLDNTEEWYRKRLAEIENG